MTREEAIICKIYLEDLDKHHTCNEYKLLMGLLERESCDDAISRKIITSFLSGLISDDTERKKALKYINGLPPVTPQPKTGHWIEDTNGTYTDNHDTWECSECGHAQILLEGTPKDNDYNYCPNCGAKMVEPQERSDKCSKCKYHINPDYTRCKECGAERSDKE